MKGPNSELGRFNAIKKEAKKEQQESSDKEKDLCKKKKKKGGDTRKHSTNELVKGSKRNIATAEI